MRARPSRCAFSVTEAQRSSCATAASPAGRSLPAGSWISCTDSRSSRRCAPAWRRSVATPQARWRALAPRRLPRRQAASARQADPGARSMPETLIGKVVRRQSWMDPLSDSVQKLVSSSYRALGAPGPALRNLMHGTVLLRHPLHPAVTDVPIGAWTVSVIADYVAHFTSRVPESAGDIALAVGLVVALLALITGYTDFAATIGLERRFGCAHGLLMTVVVLVDVVSLALRWWGSDGVHPLAVALSTVALLVLL